MRFLTCYMKVTLINVIHLDFQKNFDKVVHRRLCRKMLPYGINGNVPKWIKECLSSCEQRVVIDCWLSPIGVTKLRCRTFSLPQSHHRLRQFNRNQALEVC